MQMTGFFYRFLFLLSKKRHYNLSSGMTGYFDLECGTKRILLSYSVLVFIYFISSYTILVGCSHRREDNIRCNLLLVL